MQERLRAALIAKLDAADWSGAEAARRLGVSRSYISKLRTGHREVTVAVMRRAAAVWPDLTPLLTEYALSFAHPSPQPERIAV